MNEDRRYWNLIKIRGYGVIWCDHRQFVKCLSSKLDRADITHECYLDIHIELHLEENPNWRYYKPLGSRFGCFLCFKHIPVSLRDKIGVRLQTTFKEFYGKS